MMGSAFIDSTQFLHICPVLQGVWVHSIAAATRCVSIWQQQQCQLSPNLVLPAPWFLYRSGSCSLLWSTEQNLHCGFYLQRLPDLNSFFFPPWFPFCQALLIASIRSILTSDRSHHIFSLASVLPHTACMWSKQSLEDTLLRGECSESAQGGTCDCSPALLFPDHNPWQLHQLTRQ